MNSVFKISALLLCFVIAGVLAYGQPVKYTQTFNAAGGSNTIAGNNYEWSVGEMVLVNTGTASNIIVTQGVLQPAQSSGDVDNSKLITDNISVYPVPSQSTVFVQHNFPAPGNLQLEVLDITGKLLLKSAHSVPTGTGKQSIDLSQFANASYMLYINFTTEGGARSTSSFKLEKIN